MYLYDCGSVNKVPTWNLKGIPIAITGLFYSMGYTVLEFASGEQRVDANEITVTVVEKGVTQTLALVIGSATRYELYTEPTSLFNSSDVGKTFTIVFVPEPTGYA